MKRILVIGGGSIGERHVRCFQHTARAEVSLCEINDDVRTRVGETYQLTRTFRTLDDALEQQFDAAVICTPANLHVPMAAQLIEQRIGLLIEKPLSTTLDGTEELGARAHQDGVPVAIAYVYRSHPALGELREALLANRYGRPVEIVVTSGQHFPFYRPAYRGTYYAHRETGGGAIQDALTHLINAAEWLVGPVTRLACDAAHCILEGVDVEDTVHLLTRHRGEGNREVLGSFNLNQHQAPNETTLTVICERGALRFEVHHHRWLVCTEPGHEWTIAGDLPLERDDLFIRQANLFLNFLEGSAEPTCSFAAGLQTLRVNLAALQSVDERRWIDVPHD